MKTGQDGINLIKQFEGCRLEAYKCPAGIWTIGYGHTAGVKQGQKITQAQADAYLITDLQIYEQKVEKYAKYKWTQPEFDALVSFAYNIGSIDQLTANGTRSKKEIAEKMLLYNKAAGKVLFGLTRRREAEQELFMQKVVSSQNGCSNGAGNSSLVDCVMISPNKNSPRNHNIDTITPHCVVGQWTAEKIGDHFSHTETNASCTYGIGYDGRRVLVVDENDRSWCSSNRDNDNRSITIECASEKTAPYAMNSAVYESLIELCADICRRNGKTKLLWLGSKEKTLSYRTKSNEMVLTAHRWFANKPCPGDWLYSRYGDLAERVNKLLGSAGSVSSNSKPSDDSVKSFPVVPFQVHVIVNDLNIRSKPSMDGDMKGKTGKGVFTITEVKDGWGKLKSGAGWIWLENPAYCTIICK